MDGGDGNWCITSHRESHIGASPNKKETQIGRRNIQGNTKITIGRDNMLIIMIIFVGFFRGRDGEISIEDLVYES